MSGDGSTKVVLAALMGNSGIALLKGGAAAYTGSAAMFSEAVHSVVDAGNQLLLLYGIKESKKSATSKHPHGYYRAIYFWAFVVALMLMTVGGVVSIMEGWEKIHEPHAITNIEVNIAILLGAVFFESYSFMVAFKEFKVTMGKNSIFNALRSSKNPAVFLVLIEDTAALLGLVVALSGTLAAYYFNMPELDAIASVVIGVILIKSAIFLLYETYGLILGESAEPHVVQGIRNIIGAIPGVEHLNELLTEHRGPEHVVVQLSLDFEDTQTIGFVEQTVTRIEQTIKAAYPEVKKVYIEAQNKMDHNATMTA